jgi:hypothetical protein
LLKERDAMAGTPKKRKLSLSDPDVMELFEKRAAALASTEAAIVAAGTLEAARRRIFRDLKPGETRVIIEGEPVLNPEGLIPISSIYQDPNDHGKIVMVSHVNQPWRPKPKPEPKDWPVDRVSRPPSDPEAL